MRADEEELYRIHARLGAYAGSTQVTLAHGRWAFVKRHYPDLWRRFVAEFPRAQAET